MASIGLIGILNLLKQAAAAAYAGRNDASKWDVNIEESDKDRRDAKLKRVKMEPTGFEFDVEDEGTVIKLVALQHGTKMKVRVNGEIDDDAAVIYKPVPSVSNPSRFHLDFKRVTLGEDDIRVNLAFPK